MSEDTENDELILESDEYEKEAEDEPITVNKHIYSYPADFTLEVLLSKLNSEEITVPPFQRGYVWQQTQASKLIESFMRDLPVPPIYLFSTSENLLWIIDGHQRLITIKRFFEKKWEGNEDFKLLLGDGNIYEGKTYDNFTVTEQRKLKNTVLRAIIIESDGGESDKALYDMFERLNTGGVLLKPQEIRNCVYHGTLNDIFHDLNKIEEWREILGTNIEDKRQRDIELILRAIAFYNINDANGYTPSLKSFLNGYMKTNQNPDQAQLNEIKSIFTTTVKKIYTSLGPKPFHLKYAMNAPAFDAVFVAFAKHSKIPIDIKKRYEKLKSNKEFMEYTRDRPTGEKSVNGRIKLANDILFG